MRLFSKNTMTLTLVIILFSCFVVLPLNSVSSIEGSLTLGFREYVAVESPLLWKTQTVSWSFNCNDTNCSVTGFFVPEEDFSTFEAVINGSLFVTLYPYILFYGSGTTSASGEVEITDRNVYFFIFMHSDPASNNISLTYRVDFPPERIVLTERTRNTLVFLTSVSFFVICLLITIILERKKQAPTETTNESLDEPLKIPREDYTFTCNDCGEILKIGLENCPACSSIICCTICKLPMKYAESLAKCPFCNCISHYEHFFDWLSLSKSCPKCMRTLAQNDLICVL